MRPDSTPVLTVVKYFTCFSNGDLLRINAVRLTAGRNVERGMQALWTEATMKMTGEDVGRRVEALFVACAMACLVSQARAQGLTGSTNLPAESFGSGQANWNRLSLQGVNLGSTNAISRSSSLNVLRTTAATMLGPMASWQSLTNPRRLT
jgi:hypothetical protein